MPTETYKEWDKRVGEMLKDLPESPPVWNEEKPKPNASIPRHRIDAMFSNAKYQLWGRSFNIFHRDSRAQAAEFLEGVLGELGVEVTG